MMARKMAFRAILLTGVSALTSQAFAQEPAGQDGEREARQGRAAEVIIVTATRREEDPRDIAGSVSAFGGEALADLGAQSLADYIQRAPGVVFNNYQPGVSHVVVRGIATSSGNVQGQATTGYFLNEIPLTEPGWTIAVPDIDAFDLNRVEVLRGPQGSLFGSASMGGAVNYVANTADASGFEAALETTLSQTRNANLGYTARAMVNLPIVEHRFAARAVLLYRDDPGYIENVGTGGANDLTVGGGRLSLVFTPSADTTLSWMSMFQTIDSADNAYQIPSVGDLQRNTATPEFTDTEVVIHSARLDHDFGWASFTALAAYHEKSQDWRFDYTPIRALYNADLDLNLTNPLYINSGGESEGTSLELRLASPSGQRFEWLVGAMVFDTEKQLYEQIGSVGAAGQFDQSSLYGPGAGAVIAPDGEIFNAFYSTVSGRETALFGEATFHLTPQWRLTAGGRLFRTEVDTVSTQVGFSTYPGDPIIQQASNTEEGFSPTLSLSYTPNENLMVYGLISEGFRFGTPNVPGLSAHPIPSGSSSDKLTNYEIGVRSNWLNGDLQLDATVFYVDWTDIQLRLQTPDFFNYATNGGAASSRGIELSASWRPTDQLDLSSSVTFQEARLEEPLFILWAGTAPEGARLPGSSDWSITNTATYRFHAPFDPVFSASHVHLSEGISDLNSAIPGATPRLQGGYDLVDLRLTGTFGNADISLFGTNIFDERGVTRTVSEVNGIGQGIVRPRTIGITARWRY